MNVKILDTTVPCNQIHIRSDDYKFKMGKNDFLFEIHNSIRNPHPDRFYMTAELSSGEFPVSMFNINETNNRLDFSYGTQDESIVVPIGNYNMGQMLTKFDELLRSLSLTSTPVLNWSSVDNKISITCYNNLTLKSSSTCLKLLGFTEKQHSIEGSVDGASLVSDAMCDIRGYTNLFFHTDLFSNGFSHKTQHHNSTHDVLARIPVDAGAYGTILYKPLIPHTARIPKSSIKVFRVSIRDFDGKIVDMNLMKWSATITIRFHLLKSIQSDYQSPNASTSIYQNSNQTYQTPHLLRQALDAILKEYKDGKFDYSKLTVN